MVFQDGAGYVDTRRSRIAGPQPFYDNQENFDNWTPDTMPDQDDLYVVFMFLHSRDQKRAPL